MIGMYINKMPSWCAGCKLSGLNDWNRPTLESILQLWKERDKSASLIVVSCGAEETNLMKHLKSIGFIKTRSFRNYGHSSKPTWLMVYQIPKKIWCKETGYNGEGNWTRNAY